MRRVLSGIQPSGQLHLGNYAGAIRQFVDMHHTHEMYIFVASYHALTSGRDAKALREQTRQVIIDYIAFGLDPQKVRLYRQQDVPEVTELAWLLACVSPKHLMDKATSYKDKVARGLPASIGLYTYPILQAADILSVDADVVPVGATVAAVARPPVARERTPTSGTTRPTDRPSHRCIWPIHSASRLAR